MSMDWDDYASDPTYAPSTFDISPRLNVDISFNVNYLNISTDSTGIEVININTAEGSDIVDINTEDDQPPPYPPPSIPPRSIRATSVIICSADTCKPKHTPK